MRKFLTDFGVGVVCGVVIAALIFGFLFWVFYNRTKDKERIEYAERVIEVQELQEVYRSLDPVEFLEVPGVRGAADGARDEFDRKRDEILERFRGGLTD